MGSMIIVDKPRERCPLIRDFHEELAKREGIDLFERDDDDYIREMAAKGLERNYDHLLIGMGLYYLIGDGRFRELLRAYRARGTKLILEIGDVECYRFESLEGLPELDFVYFPAQPMWGYREDLIEILGQTECTREAKLILIPYGIEPKKYELNLERDIDVSFMCTINPEFLYHQSRVRISKALDFIRRKGLGYKIFRDNVYGQQYIETLNRTKILLVETGGRGVMTQKYIQGTAAGCLLMGERPRECGGMFEDGISFSRVSMYWIEEQLLPRIKYYLSRKDERENIAGEMKKRIIERNHVQVIIKRFIREIGI